MDECHHAASNTSVELLQKINAKYVVFLLPKRGDSLQSDHLYVRTFET